MEHGILHFEIFTKPKLISGSALPPAKKASQYVYAHHCHNSIFSICCRWQIVKIVHLSCKPLSFILLKLSNKQAILFDGLAPRIVSLCSVRLSCFPQTGVWGQPRPGGEQEEVEVGHFSLQGQQGQVGSAPGHRLGVSLTHQLLISDTGKPFSLREAIKVTFGTYLKKYIFTLE